MRPIFSAPVSMTASLLRRPGWREVTAAVAIRLSGHPLRPDLKTLLQPPLSPLSLPINRRGGARLPRL